MDKEELSQILSQITQLKQGHKDWAEKYSELLKTSEKTQSERDDLFTKLGKAYDERRVIDKELSDLRKAYQSLQDKTTEEAFKIVLEGARERLKAMFSGEKWQTFKSRVVELFNIILKREEVSK